MWVPPLLYMACEYWYYPGCIQRNDFSNLKSFLRFSLRKGSPVSESSGTEIRLCCVVLRFCS